MDKKDLDSWINKNVKVILTIEGAFYNGKLIEEQKNGLLLKANGKRVYLPYESILALEEL